MATFFNSYRGSATKSATAGNIIHTCAANRYAIGVVMSTSVPSGTISATSGYSVIPYVGMTFFIGPGDSLTAVGTNITMIIKEFTTTNVD